MTRLLIIADDFTGALDTGVQFAVRGASARVMTDTHFDFTAACQDNDVLVVNSETRHLPSAEAYEVVYDIVSRARQNQIPYIYKKTDSGLRGNIGAELAAAMDALGAGSMAFVPAFPQMGRITRNGIHYIDGIPVAESVFGSDPFDPVLYSSVADVIGTQTSKEVSLYLPNESGNTSSGILLYDAETTKDLRIIANSLEEKALRLCAGCAGFASALADRMQLGAASSPCSRSVDELLMVCGSLNPVTVQQMDFAEKKGYPRVRLTPDQKLNLSWLDKAEGQKELERWIGLTKSEKLCIVDVNGLETGATERYGRAHGITDDDLRRRVADTLGGLIRRLLDKGLTATLMCTGGDTLLAVMRSLGISELIPLGEMSPGVVLTEFVYNEQRYRIISKSGGFGAPDLLCKMIQKEKSVC